MQPLPLPLPKTLTVVLMLATVTLLTPESGRRAFNVAHRGASAYAPEHTIEAYRLAIEQGADYVEQDLGITKNGVLVCSHDPSLERVTNVEELFPDRFTETKVGDTTVKRWFIEDFTLAEIKRLEAGAWFDPKFTGMKVATFQEAIDFIKGKAGFFPELKTPGRVRARGFDMEKAVADILRTKWPGRRDGEGTSGRAPAGVRGGQPSPPRGARARCAAQLPDGHAGSCEAMALT
jgi:glycerophosphoryl diester phosphodiesterase